MTETVVKTCINCGETFKTRHHNKMFCHYSCRSEYKSAQLKRERLARKYNPKKASKVEAILKCCTEKDKRDLYAKLKKMMDAA